MDIHGLHLSTTCGRQCSVWNRSLNLKHCLNGTLAAYIVFRGKSELRAHFSICLVDQNSRRTCLTFGQSFKPMPSKDFSQCLIGSHELFVPGAASWGWSKFATISEIISPHKGELTTLTAQDIQRTTCRIRCRWFNRDESRSEIRAPWEWKPCPFQWQSVIWNLHCKGSISLANLEHLIF